MINESGATVMQATPTLWQALLSQADEQADEQASGRINQQVAGGSALAGLRMLVGGEALNGLLSQAMASQGGSVSNLYGPTETTIWSAAMLLGGEALDGRRWLVSRAMWNGLMRAPCRRSSDWSSDLEHAGLCFGRRVAACACGGCGGALHCGLWCCAGLSWPVWSDGGAVCCGPVWCVWEPDVPDRGRWAVAFGRGA